MTLPTCPDPELLAVCAEGRLHGGERERLLRHLTSCRECYTVFAEALCFIDERAGAGPATTEARAHEPTTPADASHDVPVSTRPADGAPAARPPDERPAEPRGNVIPFDRRRRWRVATTALPLAAAAVLAVVVMERRTPPHTPTTVAQGPSSQPTAGTTPSPPPSATPPPPATAVSLVHVDELPPHWRQARRPPAPSFGTSRPVGRRCLYAGVMSIDIEVAAQDPPLAAGLVRQAAGAMRVPLGDELSAHFERLAAEARAGRLPAPDELRPAVCAAALLDAGRAVELVRLAALKRNAALLQHPEVVAGLSAGRAHAPADDRLAFVALGRLVASAPSRGDSAAWDHLQQKAGDLTGRWP